MSGVAVSGCLGGGRHCAATAGQSGDETRRGTVSPGRPEKLLVSTEELVRAAPRNRIPAIVEPAFGPGWTDLELAAEWWGTGEKFTFSVDLEPSDRVVGVVRDGRARAYPLESPQLARGRERCVRRTAARYLLSTLR